jgi:hypothetical protein
MSTLKDLVITAYAIYACTPDKVYYLNKYKGRYAWQTIDKMKDCRNMFCIFENEISQTDLANLIADIADRFKITIVEDDGKVQIIPKVPKEADKLQISKFSPTFENGLLWTEDFEWGYVPIKDVYGN